MKQLILFLLVSVLAVSCGEKGDTGKAKFKLSIGNMLNASSSYFAGGLFITGHRLDDTQSFTMAYTDNLQLELQKGAWEFATIGWTSSANGKMTGPQQCSYQQVEVRDDNQSVTFAMSAANCINAKTASNEPFAAPEFLKITNGSGTIGFKRLKLKVCYSFEPNGACNEASASSSLYSFKVSLPANLKGITANTAPAIESDCVTINSGTGNTYLTLPYGGPNGFIKTNIGVYTSIDCTGTPVSYAYGKGLAQLKTNISAMSPVGIMGSSNTFSYLGPWVGSSTPSSTGLNRGDYYLVDTVPVTSPFTPAGYTIMWDGSAWVNTYLSPTFINGAPYFDNDEFAYFYIAQ